MGEAEDQVAEDLPALTAAEEDEQRALQRQSVRDQISEAGPVMVMGLIPLGLVLMLLGMLLGDWVWAVVPVVLLGGFYGLPLLINYRAHADSSLPLDLPRLGRLTGKAKRRTVALVSVVLLLAFVAIEMGGIALVELRQLLLGWWV